MWRAFFFAVGANLILLGTQCLVVDHIVVANGTRVPSFVADYFYGWGAERGYGRPFEFQDPSLVAGPTQSLGFGAEQQFGSNFRGSTTQPQQLQPSALSSSNGASRFGPSRFADSQFSNTGLPRNAGYYGGAPLLRQQPSGQNSNGRLGGPNSQFSLAGYGGRTASAALEQGFAGGFPTQGSQLAPVTLGQGGSRLFRPSEWMPWGLMAIGTLVVLYTKSARGVRE